MLGWRVVAERRVRPLFVVEALERAEAERMRREREAAMVAEAELIAKLRAN